MLGCLVGDAPVLTNAPRGHLGRGVLVLQLHAPCSGPVIIAAFVYGGREAAERAEEVDVGFENVPDEQLPADSARAFEPPQNEQDALEKLEARSE